MELLLEGKGWRRCVATPPAEENGERGKDRTTVQSPFLGTLYYKCRIIRGNYGGIFRARHRHQSYDLQFSSTHTLPECGKGGKYGNIPEYTRRGGIRTYSHLSGGRRTVCEVTLVLFRRHFTCLLRLLVDSTTGCGQNERNRTDKKTCGKKEHETTSSKLNEPVQMNQFQCK